MLKSLRVLFVWILSAVWLFQAAEVFASQTFQGTVFSAVTAGADHNSASVDSSSSLYGSYQCVWAGLTGTVNANVSAQVSADSGTSWDNLSGASMTFTGASGHSTVLISGVLTTPLVRLAYTHGTVSGGTVSCYLALKE